MKGDMNPTVKLEYKWTKGEARVEVHIPMEHNGWGREFDMPPDQARALAEKILEVLGEKGLDEGPG